MTSSTKRNASQNDGLRFGELAIDYSELPELSQYTARDGTVLPVRHYPLEALEPPAISDRVLVLIHGSGYHSRYLMPLAKRIAASGAAQVYTPDLRGHGSSPARRGDIDYADQLEDDLVDLITHIRESNAGARILVGGHSSGGGLALRFAGSGHRSESAGFVLLAPFLRHDSPTSRSNAGGWTKPKTLRIVALAILNAMGVSRFDDTVVIEFSMPEEIRDRTETLAYTHRLNTGLAPRNYESDLEAIETPLLVLVGDDDEAFIAEKFPETVSRHAPGGVVEILADASHMGIVVGKASAEIIIHWLVER
jgi:alpha-beta hydrolase superfamily lysophospholipase